MLLTLKHSLLRAVLLIIVFGYCAAEGLASTIIIPKDDDMIVEARAIVRGRVTAVRSAFDDQRGHVFTYITVRVKEVLKGDIRSRDIVIKQLGGEAGSRGTILFGAPEFVPGEHVLLYLSTWPDGSLCIHQFFLGKFNIIHDAATQQPIVSRSLRGSHIEVLPGAGPGAATDRMELSAYTGMVRHRLAVYRRRAEEFEATHFRNTPLRSRPPQYHLDGEGSIQPQFRLLFNARWFEPDEGRLVTFLVNPNNAPPGAIDDINAAFEALSTVSGSSLRLVTGGETSDCRPFGTGAVTFGPECWPVPAGSGAIAFGGLDWHSEQTKVVNGVTFARAARGFVHFNPSGGFDPCSTREIATHETGHAIGLGHSEDTDATMFGTAHFDGRCAGLRADDMNGIRFIYPGTGGGPGNPNISTGALPIAFLGAAYSQTFTAIGGTSPYAWSLAAGGSLPAGLSLTAGGVLSGTPSATGTSTFTIRVVDAADRSVEKDFSLTVLASGSPLNSQLTAQSVPSAVQGGQAFNVSFTWLNGGTEVWSRNTGFRIVSQNPPGNSTWGGNLVPLPGSAIIGPGQQLLITFTVFAPVTPGTYNLQFQLHKESAGFFGEASTNIAVKVTQGVILAIAGPSTAEAMVGVPFGLQFTASGGTAPYKWSLLSGSLPDVLTLDSNTGLIAGMPTTHGVFSFTLQAADPESRKGEKALSIIVRPAPVEVLTSSLGTAIRGQAYNQQLSARGGVPPYSWSITQGQLPGGLALDQATGLISGAPTATGSFPLGITARDQSGLSANRALLIVVVGPEEVPHVIKVKYKPGPGKLIVSGENFHQQCSLIVNDQTTTARFVDSTQLVVKQLRLSPGTYVIRVINPNGLLSEATLTVN